MYCFTDGWMRQWRAEGDIRVRFAPKPVCEQWWPGLRHWVPLEPGTLWMEEVERQWGMTRNRSRKRDEYPSLPGMDWNSFQSTPPKSTPGQAAEKLWQDVPKQWWDPLRSVHVYGWRSLHFLHETGSAGEDLFNSNPGLAWLLASMYMSGSPGEFEEGARRLREGLCRRQRDQLALLRLPTEKWLVKLLRRLEMNVNPKDTLNFLRFLAREEQARKIVLHLDALPSRLVKIIEPSILSVLTVPMAREMADTSLDDQQFEDYQRTVFYMGVLFRRGVDMPRFHCVREMENWLDQKKHRVAIKKIIPPTPKADYPPPPFKGNKQIIPIRTRQALDFEGSTMNHCVARLHDFLKSGRIAVYSVYHPKRATLALERLSEGQWVFFDYKFRCNHRPTKEGWTFIRQWLTGHGVWC